MTAALEAESVKSDEPAPITARDSTFVHVTVWADSSSYDIELFVHSPIVELLPDLVDELAANLESESKSSRWLRASGVQWTLAKGATGTMLDSSSSLADSGVKFGDTLYLRKRRRTEGPPMWRDDVAQGATAVSKQEFAVLEPRDVRRLAVGALPLGLLALTVLAAVTVGPIPQTRWVSLSGLAAVAVISAAVAAVLYRQYSSPDRTAEQYQDVAAALVVTAYIGAVGAAFLAVPRTVGTWHVAVMGAALLAAAIALWSLTGNRPAGLHIGVGAIGAILAAVGALHLVLPVSGQAVAAQIMWLAGLVLLIAPVLGRSASGTKLTYVAATGEPLVRDEDASVVAVSRRSTSSEAIEGMINQQQKVILSFHSLVGVVVAMAVLLPIAAAFAGAQTRQYEWYLFAAVLGVAAACFATGRAIVVRSPAVPAMIAGPVMWICYLVGRSLSDTTIPIPVLASGAVIFLVGVFIGATRAIQQRKLRSPLTKKVLELTARLGGLVALPLVGFICEMWPLLRNH